MKKISSIYVMGVIGSFFMVNMNRGLFDVLSVEEVLRIHWIYVFKFYSTMTSGLSFLDFPCFVIQQKLFIFGRAFIYLVVWMDQLFDGVSSLHLMMLSNSLERDDRNFCLSLYIIAVMVLLLMLQDNRTFCLSLYQII